jgi:PilX N-terminal
MGMKTNQKGEKGAALAVAIIILAILSVVSLTALTFSASEARIAGADLRRSQAFYAAASGIEKMTSDFSEIFRRKMQPEAADLYAVEMGYPPELHTVEGYDFDQHISEDAAKLADLRQKQGITSEFYPRVNIPDGPYAGLFASIIPYKISSKVTSSQGYSGASVKLERDFNNYLVPLFQFGVFSNEDLEFSPGPFTTFNGRVHTNGNIYAMRNIKFLSRLTAGGELVRNANRNGTPNSASGNSNVWIEVAGLNVNIDKGSVQNGGGTVGGPNILGATAGGRGFFPGSPNGIANPTWESQSVLPANGTPGRFGGQIATQSTGGAALKLPIELEGNSPYEVIKRSLPTDSTIMQASRYNGKSVVRILIDEEGAGSGVTNAAGIPAGKGVLLSTFRPIPLGGGNALRRVDDSGTYVDGATIRQKLVDSSLVDATTVREVIATPPTAIETFASGSGVTGKILIEITKPDGTTVDVTQEILSMGMTEGEPNGIVYLQRPLWAAFIQGSRDRMGSTTTLVNLTKSTQTAADGEIIAAPSFDAGRGFITNSMGSLNEDGGTIVREPFPDPAKPYDRIVPINVYNVREGWFRSSLDPTTVYERGITGVVELNMKNLGRWFDGVYDTNLLAGTQAVRANINGDAGYVVYFSDRRGDKVKDEKLPDGTIYRSTNGTVDNEDIYGADGLLQEGEDVLSSGWDAAIGAPKANSLQKDISELPDTGAPFLQAMGREARANVVMSWDHSSNNFRRSLRLFNGETLSTTVAANKLSPTKGITIASENMVYVWGNYNTTGVSSIPAGGSTMNDGVGYTGPQVPASIACDAIFPLSKTWFDGLSALYPEGSSTPTTQNGVDYRRADANLPSVTQTTSVRAAVLAGTNKAALIGFPGRDATGSRASGGVINFPRFLEIWNLNGTTTPWNYAGSFVPLFNSTQALSSWENETSVIYMPPKRNWSFDISFRTPSRIPPGTPYFQYVSVTSFRQNLKD